MTRFFCIILSFIMACTTIFGDKSKKKDSPYLIL
jgi:hypothetical protein